MRYSQQTAYNRSPARQAAHKRYDGRRSERRKAENAQQREAKFRALEFVAWDGEGSKVEDGTPQPYMLFGNTDGLSIQREQLGTAECLELICQGDPTKVNFSFAFGYDVNQICWELPSRVMNDLSRGRVVNWKDYSLEWVEEKWFRVRRNRKSNPSKWIKIYDVFHYFNRALVKVLDEYEIGDAETREYLRKMKAERAQFTWEEIEEVKRYWTIEGQMMVRLMEYIRDLFADAGFYVTSWHGPGAVARIMLTTRGIKDAKQDLRKTRPEVWIAARYAYSAGRFELFEAGYYDGPVFNYDIHSAFPYAMLFLPNLATGEWHHTIDVDRSRIDKHRFAVYLIKYDDSKNWKSNAPRPLFRRLKNDIMCWPSRVNGWYWSPEAELVKGDPAATFVEAWEFDDDGSRPMAWINEMYHTRQYHQRLGNAVQYAFKLGMNSIYGQFAQRAGWEHVRNSDGSMGGPPAFHQLEWAGYITSMCKAMVFHVARWAYDNGGLLTIDTDGVFTTVRIPESVLPNGIGDELGQWEETIYERILLWQNGFYWLYKNGKWIKARSRGAPRGTVPLEKAWEALDRLELGLTDGNHTMLKYSKHIFTGYRKARQGGHFSKWRSWQTIPQEMRFAGTTKRYHSALWCPKCVYYRYGLKRPGWNSRLHLCRAMDPNVDKNYEGKDDYWSIMHRLHWVEGEDDSKLVDEIEFPEDDEIYEDATL